MVSRENEAFGQATMAFGPGAPGEGKTEPKPQCFPRSHLGAEGNKFERPWRESRIDSMRK